MTLGRHIRFLDETIPNIYEPLSEINMVGVGHTLYFLPHENNKLTGYDFDWL